MASYLDENRPDFGQMSMDSAGFDSAERNAGVAGGDTDTRIGDK